MTAEHILERALNFAGNGIQNPLQCLAEVGRVSCGDIHLLPEHKAKHDCPFAAEHRRAFMAAVAAAGGGFLHSFTGDTVQLFRDALFNVQMGVQ